MDNRPLFFGRLLRILAGAALCIWLWLSPPQGLAWQGLMLFLGVSMIVGGVMAYAGCEILALPNLLFGKRLHCF
jgi:hypothetical protein